MLGEPTPERGGKTNAAILAQRVRVAVYDLPSKKCQHRVHAANGLVGNGLWVEHIRIQDHEVGKPAGFNGTECVFLAR